MFRVALLDVATFIINLQTSSGASSELTWPLSTIIVVMCDAFKKSSFTSNANAGTVIRNSLKYVAGKDQKAFMKDLSRYTKPKR